MTERSNMADLLRAAKELNPKGDDILKAIAGLLGLQLKSQSKASSKVAQRKIATTEPIQQTGLQETAEPFPETKPRQRIESVLLPANASRNPAPYWLATARQLDTTDTAHFRLAIPLEPLFPSRASRAILGGALATPALAGPLNLGKVIELLSRAEAIREAPRFVIPTLVRGVQLLIDRGEGMQPFAMDQSILRSALVSVVGRDRTQVMYFDSLPLWGTGTGPKDEWPDYQTPTPRTPVVVLTDLGTAQPAGVAGLATGSDWRTFAEMLARAGCPLLALVPYPPSRWPALLSKSMTIIQWDRATTASVIRRAVPTGLRVTKEI